MWTKSSFSSFTLNNWPNHRTEARATATSESQIWAVAVAVSVGAGVGAGAGAGRRDKQGQLIQQLTTGAEEKSARVRKRLNRTNGTR